MHLQIQFNYFCYIDINITKENLKMTSILNQEANNRLINITKILVGSEMNLTSQQLHIFLLVCSNQGLSSKELEEKTGFHKATTSRILRVLSERDGQREGHCLINLVHDEKDYRVRRAYLTDKGELLALRLQAVA